MRDHEHVDLSFVTSAPVRVVLTQDLPASAATVFRCFEDGAAWADWLGLDVTWTSSLGPDATRTVTTGKQVLDEHFPLWEPGERMVFRLDRSTLPVTAFAEDYILTPNGPDACRLEWTYAISAANGLTARAVGALMWINSKRSLPKLVALLRDHSDRWAA